MGSRMEFVDFLKVDFFNQLRDQMGAPLLDISDLPFRTGITYADIFDLYEGQEIGIDDVQVSTEGLLYYKGVMVTLNIQDAFQRGNTEENLPRLHLSNCKKINEMKTAGRIQRYISSSRNDKVRKIRFIANENYIVKTKNCDLDVCKYCLAQIRWQGYHSGMTQDEKNNISKNLDLNQFYKQFEPQFFQEMIDLLFTDKDKIKLNSYQKNWNFISYEFRKSKGWKCESCAKDCQNNHSELHTHHINGNKADNNPRNLSALCYDCHAKQPMHEHMRR